LRKTAQLTRPVGADKQNSFHAILKAGLHVGDIAMTPPAILDRDDIMSDKNETHAAIAPRSAFAGQDLARRACA
jgi:hypothetical protein